VPVAFGLSLPSSFAASEIGHVPLFTGSAKWVRRVEQAGRFNGYVDMAVTAATTGRPGPAVLLLSVDSLQGKSEA